MTPDPPKRPYRAAGDRGTVAFNLSEARWDAIFGAKIKTCCGECDVCPLDLHLEEADDGS